MAPVVVVPPPILVVSSSCSAIVAQQQYHELLLVVLLLLLLVAAWCTGWLSRHNKSVRYATCRFSLRVSRTTTVRWYRYLLLLRYPLSYSTAVSQSDRQSVVVVVVVVVVVPAVVFLASKERGRQRSARCDSTTTTLISFFDTQCIPPYSEAPGYTTYHIV